MSSKNSTTIEASSPITGLWRPLLTALVCACLAWGLYQGRKQTIARFFSDASPQLDLHAGQAPARAGSPQAPIRVVLLDGLGFRAASSLPALSMLCAQGLELRVDTGFPTVSLPVQQVLWTGLTQQQSGVLYRSSQHAEAPAGSLPAQIPGSMAVAESHPFIAASFGFTHLRPLATPDSSLPERWRETGFIQEAERVLSSNAQLAFVHVLRIDEAGHASGARSDDYTRAAVEADGWLKKWVDLAPDARWLILADHGHLPGGGHAGRDSGIPFVRACMFGPGVEASAHSPAPTVHLVDLSLALFSWAGLSPSEGTLGRPLQEAPGLYRAGEHLESPDPLRFLIACVFIIGSLGLAIRFGAGPHAWWIVASYLTFVIMIGVPSLSMPPIYPPLGWLTIRYGAPGLIALAAIVSLSPHEIERVVLRQLLPILALAASAHLLAWGAPPLMPIWTAHASVFTTWAASACALACVALVLYLGRSMIRPSRRAA